MNYFRKSLIFSLIPILMIFACQSSEEKNLKHLDIFFNQVNSLPPEIGELPHLQRFNVSCNQLETLPPELGQLTELKYLDLRDNQLTKLPKELKSLTNLVYLDLRGNPLPADQEILNRVKEPAEILKAIIN